MLDDLQDHATEADAQDRYFGKYRGIVFNNQDPFRLGRLQVMIPEVLGEIPSGWASPCTPYAGTLAGFYAIPLPGAGVWIEFEAGDVSRPIWVGGWWAVGEIPPKAAGAPAMTTSKVLRSDTGFTIVLDDLAQNVTISDIAGTNQIEVCLATGTVTLKGLARVVTKAPLVQHGSDMAAHPAVLGDQLMAYLTTLVGLFNTHVHPGELALGVLPVTPAPAVAPFPPPPPTILSTKVLLE
ncbi:MAG: phage baseplate assembly protein V [Geminicoccaceae bacterium]